MGIDDGARIRELCERASNEQNAAKLLELVRQINEILEQRTHKSQDKSDQAASHCGPATTSLDARSKGLTDDAGHDLENPT